MNRKGVNEESNGRPTQGAYNVGGGGNWMSGFPVAPTGTPGPGISPSPSGNGTQRRSPRASVQDPERILLFLMIDYLKRRQMTGTAAQLIAECRIERNAPETGETVRVVEALTLLHGRNPQPGVQDLGFLRDWWATFWSMYQTKLQPILIAPGRARVPANNPAPVHNLPPVSPKLDNTQMRRMLLINAMNSLGMGGRDPHSLTTEEQQQLHALIQKQLAGTAMRSATSGGAPLRAEVGGGNAAKKKRTNVFGEQQYQSNVNPNVHQYPHQSNMPISMMHGLPNLAPLQARRPSIFVDSAASSSNVSGTASAGGHQDGLGDDNALLNFFGSPAEWFASSADNNHDNTHENMLDMPRGSSVGESVSSYTSNSVELPDIPLAPEPILECPMPDRRASMLDPNDLLLVVNEEETAEEPQVPPQCTESGFRLTKVSDLGSHQVGSKALSASFSHDGLIMATGGNDKRVLVFSTITKRLLFVLEGQHTEQITQVRFCPSGGRRLLATSSFDKTITVWDLGLCGANSNSDGVEEEKIPAPEAPMLILKDVHDEPVWSIDFVPPSEPLPGSWTGDEHPGEGDDRERSEEFGTNSNNSTSSDNKMMRLCSIDACGKLVIWDVETGIALFTTTVKASQEETRVISNRQVKTQCASPIVAVTNGGTIEFFDCDRTAFIGTLIASQPVGDQKAKSVVTINWGDASRPNLLVTATAENVSIWDVEPLLKGTGSANLLASQSAAADKITCCSLLLRSSHEDGILVVYGGYQSIYLWDYVSTTASSEEERINRLNRPLKIAAHEGLVVSLPFTRTGQPLIGSASHDGHVKLWLLKRDSEVKVEEETETKTEDGGV